MTFGRNSEVMDFWAPRRTSRTQSIPATNSCAFCENRVGSKAFGFPSIHSPTTPFSASRFLNPIVADDGKQCLPVAEVQIYHEETIFVRSDNSQSPLHLSLTSFDLSAGHLGQHYLVVDFNFDDLPLVILS